MRVFADADAVTGAEPESALAALRRTRTVLPGLRYAARACGDRLAVAGPDAELSFREFDELSDRLAGAVAAAGGRSATLVAVLLPRTAELVAAFVAVLKCGAAFVPLDPEQPSPRIAAILAEAGVSVLVTTSELAERHAVGGDLPVLALDRIDPAAPTGALPREPAPDDLAYVIFTSGSTGTPKGVQISHRSLATFFLGLDEAGVFGPVGTRVGWNASVSFDPSVQQWGRIFRGDSVVVFDEAARRDTALFAGLVETARIDEFDTTPSHVRVLLDEVAAVARRSGRSIRVLVGGEAIDQPLWDRLSALGKQGLIEPYNMYGPTEVTIAATSARITAGVRPHLGEPFAEVGVRVLDAAGRPVADGTEGELGLVGPMLARGYLRRPELTARRFVEDPLEPGSRMYLTGDLVVRTADGALEYRGRIDEQVKIRGHRVEPGEIESTLGRAPGVVQIAVVPDTRSGALHAFVELSGPAALSAVRDHAARHLPEWMCPSAYSVVAAIPRTIAGKADKAALAALLDQRAAPEPVATGGSGVSGLVLAVWGEVLGSEIGADTDFFDSGGHSLSAMHVATRLTESLAFRVPTRLLFENKRFAEFEAAVCALAQRAGAEVG
ncbi:non-ribosomal peptide synthetase [Allokutzneria sp. A3M-2-11 16]|uniref:non-ribosomal peptide synthetase n=1 Tax=Allokutzneria sp. A3M-2-11 16 TaxID=2962043 RepID=UPI0020B78338|nr:non-ribosomal peptide synthetase [Allokutzneria sp. A3M-2-11 16]MCP3803371.1 non-ribosomal peptide synthetase [Allokutzneria sp. A3M-2-11 16]